MECRTIEFKTLFIVLPWPKYYSPLTSSHKLLVVISIKTKYSLQLLIPNEWLIIMHPGIHLCRYEAALIDSPFPKWYSLELFLRLLSRKWHNIPNNIYLHIYFPSEETSRAYVPLGCGSKIVLRGTPFLASQITSIESGPESAVIIISSLLQ